METSERPFVWLLSFFIVLLLVGGALSFILNRVQDSTNAQYNADYHAVTTMNISKLKVGNVIDLSNYSADLDSSNSNIVKIREDGSIWAAAPDTAAIMVTNEANSKIHKAITVEVVK